MIRTILVLFATLCAIGTADAACFADAYGVWRYNPGSWAGWTRQMPGHVGEKCYYPTTKAKLHNHGKEVRHIGQVGQASPPIRGIDAKPQSEHKQTGARHDALFAEFLEWNRKQQLYEMGLPK